MIPCQSSVQSFDAQVGGVTNVIPNSDCLQKFKLYMSKAKFYFVGTNETETFWKVLEIDRSETADLKNFEDPAIYSTHECNDLLNRLDAANQSTGGLKFVTDAYAIVGFIKFLEPYYMILVTKRQLLGNVCGHPIYGITESQLIIIPHTSFQTNVAASQTELRYKNLFNSIDLSKDFFFSYTYRIMWSLQKNVSTPESDKMPYDNMFVWNSFLTQGFQQQESNSQWTVAVVHGFFKQRSLSLFGTESYKATLIARRSRHFAGTRYLKRGVNKQGQVANDVETEQLIHKEPWGELNQISSVVQHRGSIPLFWSQETSILSPKPDIKLRKHDNFYEATRLHFEDLIARYGNPIIVLNLIKTMEKRPRETVLYHEFAKAVEYLNLNIFMENSINFIHWDLHKASTSGSKNVLEVLGNIATKALNHVGFYYNSKLRHPKWNGKDGSWERQSRNQEIQNEMELREEGKSCKEQERKAGFQNGVLRSNCIDCIDRTNVAQYAFGLAALGQQMHALGLSNKGQVSADSGIGSVLMDMYKNMGDVLALQYGGSTAHNIVFSNSQGKWKAATQSLYLLRSIKRHYSNAYTDGEKQNAIDLFLGHFQPKLGKPSLWQVEFDNYPQIRQAEKYHSNDFKPSSFNRSFSVLERVGVLSVEMKHPTSNSISRNNLGNTQNNLYRGKFSTSDPSLNIAINGDLTSISRIRHLITEADYNLYNCSSPLSRMIEEAELDQPWLQQFEGIDDTVKGDAMEENNCSCDPSQKGLLAYTEIGSARDFMIDKAYYTGLNVESIREKTEIFPNYSESFRDWIEGCHFCA